MRAFYDLKFRSDGSIGRRRGGVIHSLRTRVAKRRHPPKNLQSDSVSKPVPNADVALLLEKLRLEYLYNFGYFASMTILERLMCFFCGLDVIKRITSLPKHPKITLHVPKTLTPPAINQNKFHHNTQRKDCGSMQPKTSCVSKEQH